MGSLERRLRTLENTAGFLSSPEEREERLRREVLRRMTDEELWRYEEVLEAAYERSEGSPGGVPVQWRDEGLPILRRVEELWREVRDGAA